MKTYRLGLAVGLSALLCGAAAIPAQAAPAAAAPTPLVTGLFGALHLSLAGGQIYVADAFAGKVYRADPATGAKTVLATAPGVTSVSVGANGRVFGTFADEQTGATALVRVTAKGTSPVADLLAWEKAHNPDGQPQQTGSRVDQLSNPYDVLAQQNRVLVADAAGNDVLSVGIDGTVRTLTVLPVSKKGACATTTNNGVKNGGCDPVPTEMTIGQDGFLYVSGLGAEVEGHVWKIEQSSGRIVAQWDGLPPLTGIAASPAGNLYVSSLFTNKVYRLGPTGKVWGAVTVPGAAGLKVLGGQVYVASTVLPSSDTAPPVGSIYKVPVSAFYK